VLGFVVHLTPIVTDGCPANADKSTVAVLHPLTDDETDHTWTPLASMLNEPGPYAGE
jgi:hypothetical protein